MEKAGACAMHMLASFLSSFNCPLCTFVSSLSFSQPLHCCICTVYRPPQRRQQTLCDVYNHSFHRSLEVSLKDSKPVAIQLRMLEVFTSHDSYHNPADSARNRKDAALVTVYLVRNGNLDSNTVQLSHNDFFF